MSASPKLPIKFREKRRNANYTLLAYVNDLIPVLSVLLGRFV